MIYDGNLLLKTPDSKQTNFQNDQRGNLLLETPHSRQSNFQWGAEVSGINDLICHKIFLRAVSFFPNPMVEPFMF